MRRRRWAVVRWRRRGGLGGDVEKMKDLFCDPEEEDADSFEI